MADATATIDLAAIKQRQQATWASGDYHMIGTQILIVSELLIEALDLRSTERVLDVATGSGNAALAAARRGCAVVGLDYVPALLERARRRAEAEGLEAEFVEGDAEALPFDDGAFDVVSSVFGAMFAPNQEQTADELARVCRPGGRIGLVAHTPEGFIGQLFKTIGQFIPPPPALQSPALWGTEQRLRELFGGTVDIQAQRRHFVFRYRSPQHWLDVFRTYYGPVHKAFAALDVNGQEALAKAVTELLHRFNRASDHSLAVARCSIPHYGTGFTRQCRDYARSASGDTAIAGFDRGASAAL